MLLHFREKREKRLPDMFIAIEIRKSIRLLNVAKKFDNFEARKFLYNLRHTYIYSWVARSREWNIRNDSENRFCLEEL